MMRDRLLHLKKLLSADGTIWVHLDETESHRMRLLLDEIFGAGNFIAEMVWQRKTSSQSDTSHISLDTDYIAVYARNKDDVHFNGLPRTAASESAYGNPDDDPRGPWRESDYKMKSGAMYPIIHPRTGEEIYPPAGTMWRYSEKTHQQNLADNRLYWGKTLDYRYPKFKRFRSEVADTRIPNNLLLADEVDTTRRAKQHLKDVFDSGEFSTPKPERLLERIIHIATNPGDIVLDCFAGSGTTAAVAQKMGRRWITCELLETTFRNFTLPRLTKVVNDLDVGGVSRTKGARIAADGVELPEDMEPDDAATFTRVLNKLIKDSPTLAELLEPTPDEQNQGKGRRRKRKDPPSREQFDAVVKLPKAASKTTRSKEQVNWRGGGGFQVAHLSPECFDYDADLDRVMLTDAATGDTLKRSVAANLGFRLLDPDDETDEDTFAALCFHGRRGNAFLYVYEGAASMGLVDWLVSRIRPGETIVLAVTSVTDGIREHLRRSCKGSRVVVIPDDIFRFSKGGDE